MKNFKMFAIPSSETFYRSDNLILNTRPLVLLGAWLTVLTISIVNSIWVNEVGSTVDYDINIKFCVCFVLS